jgi:hypothetical protein
MKSEQFTLNKEDIKKVLKALFYYAFPGAIIAFCSLIVGMGNMSDILAYVTNPNSYIVFVGALASGIIYITNKYLKGK